MKEYQPAEGSQTEKVLAHLREHGPACAGSAEPQDFKLAAWNDGDLVLTGPGLRIMADDQGNADSVILSAAQAAALVRFVTQPRVAL